MTDFLHGVEVNEINTGPRPIRTVRSSVIGLVGTAPNADASLFPFNTPVLIAGSRSEAAPLGSSGTLPPAMDDIFDQCGAMVVVIRVEEGETEAGTLSNIIGGVDEASGQRLGVQALLDAKSVTHAEPKILAVPEFTHHQAVIAEMLGIADRLRAIIVADGPNTNDQDAITYRNNFGSRRVYLVDPGVKVWDTDTDSEIIRPASTRAAGLIAKSDSDSGRGFWWSPSNQQIYGITGTARAIDFTLGDKNARANFLNENEVTTIIHEKGYRLWGNRTCSSDPKWAFLNVRRTADMINESILQAHLWAVDRNINRTYVDDVLEGLQEYLLLLRRKEAIINGTAWVDPAHNPSGQIMEGNVKFCFDFSANYPAERVTVQSMMVDDYLVEIFE